MYISAIAQTTMYVAFLMDRAIRCVETAVFYFVLLVLLLCSPQLTPPGVHDCSSLAAVRCADVCTVLL